MKEAEHIALEETRARADEEAIEIESRSLNHWLSHDLFALSIHVEIFSLDSDLWKTLSMNCFASLKSLSVQFAEMMAL